MNTIIIKKAFQFIPQHPKHILAILAKIIPLIEAQGGKIPKILLEYQNGFTENTQFRAKRCSEA